MVLTLLTFVLQIFCGIYDYRMFIERSQVLNGGTIRKYPPNLLLRCFSLIGMTIMIAALRLAQMNFQRPKFQAADNPVAAADDFFTRVSV